MAQPFCLNMIPRPLIQMALRSPTVHLDYRGRTGRIPCIIKCQHALPVILAAIKSMNVVLRDHEPVIALCFRCSSFGHSGALKASSICISVFLGCPADHIHWALRDQVDANAM